MVSQRIVPDNFQIRCASAQATVPNSGYSYADPLTYVHRITDPGKVLKFRQKDFDLIIHKEPLENPCHISENFKLPKFWDEKSIRANQRREIADGLKNKAVWAKYHVKNLPQTHVALA